MALIRNLRTRPCSIVPPKQTAFLISCSRTQSSQQQRTVEISAGDQECFKDSCICTAALQNTDINNLWCSRTLFCQQKPKGTTKVCDVDFGRIQSQDHPVQMVTESYLRCIQHEKNGQVMSVIHKRWGAFSVQMQTAQVTRPEKGLAPSKPNSPPTSSCSRHVLSCHWRASEMQNLLEHHYKMSQTWTAGTTMPLVRRYTTSCGASVPTALLSKSSTFSSAQQTISQRRSTKPPTQWFSNGGPRAMLQMKRLEMLHPGRGYSSSKDTVEKQLLHLMERWEMEDAVALLRESVECGTVPHPNVVLDLQQQLANLGEVEGLMELHDFLKEHNLTSDAKFFHCLKEAYYNSGRISEGVEVLRLLYHRTRKFSDVDVFFTLLTVMVLRHFPDRIDLVLSFVKDLKDAEVPVLEPEASLWKCYMMTERWAEADDLLLKNEELRPLLPQQVARVCQAVDKAQFDQVVVLSQLLDLPFIRQKLRVLVAEMLIAELVSQKQWPKLLKSLKRMKSLSLPLRTNKLPTVLDDLQHYLTPQYDEQIQELRAWLDSFQRDDNQ